MPGSQGQDVIFQLAGLWSMAKSEMIGKPRALAGDFNFSGQILPTNKKVFYRIDIQRFLKKKKILFFKGSIAVDQPDNFIYEFENCKLGFYSGEELGITQRSFEYYQPDWEKVKTYINNYIEQAKSFLAAPLGENPAGVHAPFCPKQACMWACVTSPCNLSFIVINQSGVVRYKNCFRNYH